MLALARPSMRPNRASKGERIHENASSSGGQQAELFGAGRWRQVPAGTSPHFEPPRQLLDRLLHWLDFACGQVAAALVILGVDRQEVRPVPAPHPQQVLSSPLP